MPIKKIIQAILITGGVLLETGIVFAQGPSLETLIETALKNNPLVQEHYHAFKAEEYKVHYVKGLPDPQASFTHFEKNVETRVGPQERKYGLMQKVPFPGKLRLKGKVQKKTAEMAKARYEAVKRDVIKDVKWTYFDLYWIDVSLQITEEERSNLESVERTAQKRYELDLVPYRDVMKAQVELSRIIEKIYTLNQHRKSLVARMNGLLNRPKETAIDTIKEADMNAFIYDLETVLEKARHTQPEYLAARSRLDQSGHERSLARMDYFPDFTFGTEYIDVGGGTTAASNDGDDAFMATVSVNLPIWFGKLNAQLKEKRERHKAAKKGLESREDQLEVDVQDLYYRINSYKDIVLLYETAVVPQARASYEATVSGFEAEEADFLNFLEAHRMYLQTRLAYHRAVVDYQKSIAHLERVIGEDL